MCGRITSGRDPDRIRGRFQVDGWSQVSIPLKPRFNIAPATDVPTIVFKNGKRLMEPMKWGIFRQWDKSKPPRFIVNLRAEKLARGVFKSNLTQRRCIVPADGFYEWQTKGRQKQPVYFQMKDEEYFGLPAIYDEPSPDIGPAARTFTIFTTEPNALVAQFHDRMPAILTRGDEPRWLDPSVKDLPDVLAMLRPYEARSMKAHYVSTAVNKATNDRPELIAALRTG